jgi:hypothetical protein
MDNVVTTAICLWNDENYTLYQTLEITLACKTARPLPSYRWIAREPKQQGKLHVT